MSPDARQELSRQVQKLRCGLSARKGVNCKWAIRVVSTTRNPQDPPGTPDGAGRRYKIEQCGLQHSGHSAACHVERGWLEGLPLDFKREIDKHVNLGRKKAIRLASDVFPRRTRK